MMKLCHIVNCNRRPLFKRTVCRGSSWVYVCEPFSFLLLEEAFDVWGPTVLSLLGPVG